MGARRILVAYNVFLDTDDVEVARRIARESLMLDCDPEEKSLERRIREAYGG